MFKVLLLMLLNQRGAVGFMGSEGAEAPEVETPNTEAPPEGGETSDPAQVQYKYPETLDQTYHGNPTLLKYANKDGSFNMGNIMKSLIHASSVVGADKISVPTKEFTTDQWKQTFHKLGLPESIDKYEVKNNIPEGIEADPEMFEGLKKVAYESGLLPKQAQAVVDYLNQTVGNSLQKNKELLDQHMEQNKTVLQKEWGNFYDQNVKIANAAVGKFADEEMTKFLNESGLLAEPAMAKLFHKIGSGLLEDNFDPKVKGSIGMTENQLKERIESFYKEDHPFMNSNHPQNQYYRGEYMKMMEKLHGTEKVI